MGRRLRRQEVDFALVVGANRQDTSRSPEPTVAANCSYSRPNGVTLGVRFGMTGVLLIDGEAGIDGLFYGPHSFRSQWVRGGLEFDDGRRLILHDPRRLARFEIDPNLSALGPDALRLTRDANSTGSCGCNEATVRRSKRDCSTSGRRRRRQPAGRRDAVSRGNRPSNAHRALGH